MTCFYPMTAFRVSDGSVVFKIDGRRVVKELKLPCGQCSGCRLERARQWAMRCMHEASLHKENCFLTLTYNDENLPFRGSLDYSDFQRFMKRFRRYLDRSYLPEDRPSVSFYMCGEYGEKFYRPHFHCCLFGYRFPDSKWFKRTASGSDIYRSAILESLWTAGNSSIGEMTFESASYVARYCMQKRTGKDAKAFYERVDPETGEVYDLVPEFNRMSLKKPIGKTWYRQFKDDVYPQDYVVSRGGKKSRPPRAYDKWYTKDEPMLIELVKAEREANGRSHADDNTPERLRVRRLVSEAQNQFFKRSQVG